MKKLKLSPERCYNNIRRVQLITMGTVADLVQALRRVAN